jgi:hypothetical protein
MGSNHASGGDHGHGKKRRHSSTNHHSNADQKEGKKKKKKTRFSFTDSDEHGGHEHGGHEHGGHGHGGHGHGGHGHGGHGHGNCLLDTFFGKDSTSFEFLIQDVTDQLKTLRLAKRGGRKKILRALKKKKSLKDLYKYIRKSRKRFGALRHLGSSLSRTFTSGSIKKINEKVINNETKQQSDSESNSDSDSDSDSDSNSKNDNQYTESFWYTEEGKTEMKVLIKTFYNFIDTRDGGEEKDNNINFSDLKWGINTLFHMRLDDGMMTSEQAKILTRALDVDGSGTLTCKPTTLFPRPVLPTFLPTF